MSYDKLAKIFNLSEAPEEIVDEADYFLGIDDREYAYSLANALEDIYDRIEDMGTSYISKASIKYMREKMIECGMFRPVDVSIEVYGMNGLLSASARAEFILNKIRYESV